MKKFAFILALAVLAASPSFADNMPVNADGLTWGPAPPVLPKGAKIAILEGDPTKRQPRLHPHRWRAYVVASLVDGVAAFEVG